MQQGQLLTHLVQAKSHICRSERLVARQRELVVKLSRHGHDVTEAMAQLQQLVEVQALHVANCTRLRRALGLPT